MSITFWIGKDDITRKINTCLLPLELVKTKNAIKGICKIVRWRTCRLQYWWQKRLKHIFKLFDEEPAIWNAGKKVKWYFQTVRWRTCRLKYWGNKVKCYFQTVRWRTCRLKYSGNKVKWYFQTVRWRTCRLKYWENKATWYFPTVRWRTCRLKYWWLVTHLDQTHLGWHFWKKDTRWSMQLCINDTRMHAICAWMFICMYTCINECMNIYMKPVWLVWLYIIGETDKTGQVRWEADWHRSTNTRQSFLGITLLEMSQTLSG